MAKISTFLYCENVKCSSNGELLLSGPMQVITPRYIPSMFSFSIFIGLIELDITKPHTLQFKIINKTIDKVIADTGALRLQNEEMNITLPEDMRGIMANLDFRNISLETEGEYKTDVILDGEFLGTFPIKVKAVNNEQPI